MALGEFLSTWQGTAGIVRDAIFSSKDPTTRFDSQAQVRVGHVVARGTDNNRGYMDFDLSDSSAGGDGAIPANAIIRFATLVVNVTAVVIEGGWPTNEQLECWGVVRTVGYDSGTPPSPTYENYDAGVSTWNTPGLAYDPTDISIFPDVRAYTIDVPATTGLFNLHGSDDAFLEIIKTGHIASDRIARMFFKTENEVGGGGVGFPVDENTYFDFTAQDAGAGTMPKLSVGWDSAAIQSAVLVNTTSRDW